MDGRRYFEYIVVGCGGIGSGTVYWLSKRAGIGNMQLVNILFKTNDV